jgi:hypothetical protein
MSTSRRVAIIVGVVGLLAGIGVFSAYDTGQIGPLPHRVERLVHWGGCTPTQIPGTVAGNPSVAPLAAASDRFLYITCGFAGPGVTYFRFHSARYASQVVASWSAANRDSICLVDAEALVDSLDQGFPQLCRAVDGRLLRPRTATRHRSSSGTVPVATG